MKEYSISPALPDGVSLDTLTGKISGTPTVETDETKYLVTAKNADGSTESPLIFAVKEKKVYPLLRPMEIDPRIAGMEEYSISPGLPDGICLDPLTGKISGTPTVETDETKYLVTGKNA